jgi:hypothetical protein
MTTNLSERAMLANISISTWAATRTDKKISQEVADRHSVTMKRAGHYRKHAIDIDAQTYLAVHAAGATMRDRHYWWTLPWIDKGARILPAPSFDKYSTDMRALRGKFNAAVADFVAAYPALKLAAKAELNGLYNDRDYPLDIGSKFGVQLSILPLPDAGDFRANLPQADVDAIKLGITADMERAMATAMREPYERLYEHISRMVDRLKDPKGIFRDTLVTGLADLCTVLPALNITNDRTLGTLCKKAESLVIGLDAKTLREEPKVRKDVAKKAADIQAMMAGLMGDKS